MNKYELAYIAAFLGYIAVRTFSLSDTSFVELRVPVVDVRASRRPQRIRWVHLESAEPRIRSGVVLDFTFCQPVIRFRSSPKFSFNSISSNLYAVGHFRSGLVPALPPNAPVNVFVLKPNPPAIPSCSRK